MGACIPGSPRPSGRLSRQRKPRIYSRSCSNTDACIRATLHGAITRGYDVTLVADAHTTEDLTEFGAPPPELVVAHTNLYWQYHKAPGRTAGTVNAADVDFAGPSDP